MEQKICQSCAMPIVGDTALGTNADGSKSEDYCGYCFKNGEFTEDVSMEQMIKLRIEHLEDWGLEISGEHTAAMMNASFPALKRWAKA